MNIGNGLQRFGRIERGALREFDQDVDCIGAGQFGVETATCGDRLLLVRYLVCQTIARFESGVDDSEAADEQHRNEAEQAGAADHSHRDPVTEIPQHLHASVGALEFDGKDLFIAHEQHAEYRHQRQYRDQRDDGCGQPRFAEFSDQVGIRKLKRNERDSSRAMRQYASRPHDHHGIAESRVLVLPRNQAVTRRKGKLHRIRKADHHDQRRHQVQKHIGSEIRPAENAERQQNSDNRRERRHHHERYLAEENDGDDTAGQNAENVVGQTVALDRVADFELHHRNAGQFNVQAGVPEVLLHQLSDVADGFGELVARNHLRFKREHDQRQRAVFRQQFAANEFVRFHRFDELVVVGSLRQFGRKQRRWEFTRRRRLTRREQGDQAAGALHKLQVGDKITELFEIVARKQIFALDHDEHVEFRRREAFDFRFILPVFAGVGAKELAQGIVDLDALDSENRTDDERHENDAGPDRRLNRNESDPFEPEGNTAHRPLLDFLDVDFTLAVLFEHALSNSHISSTSKVRQNNRARKAPTGRRSAIIAFENIR